jgi:hypothetical protein
VRVRRVRLRVAGRGQAPTRARCRGHALPCPDDRLLCVFVRGRASWRVFVLQLNAGLPRASYCGSVQPWHVVVGVTLHDKRKGFFQPVAYWRGDVVLGS